MKAITAHEFGGPEVLQIEEIDKPVPKENEVLIEVHASSLNPVDVKSIRKDSNYKSAIHLPITPGMDVAGIVERVGKDIANIQVGDKVFGQASVLRNGSGAFAEYAVTTEDSIALMPVNLNFVEAASVPLAACSAYQAIIEHIQLKRNQKILIHGGSGGIGSFAIQLARYIGAYVATTAAKEGIPFASELGADEVIDYEHDMFEKKLQDYDAVFDTVGGATYTKSYSVLKPGGVIVSMLSKPDVNLMKQHGVIAILEMTKINQKTLSEIADLIEQDFIKVKVSRTYSLHETRNAFKAKEEEKILGKIAIDVKP
jgi:alcohol dehydrogenase